MSARSAGPTRPKHVPMRRCLACRASRPQAELVRLVQEDGLWRLDPGRKAPGRGAWLCRDAPACHSVKALKRSLKGQAERLAEELERLAAPIAPENAPEEALVSAKTARVRVRQSAHGANETSRPATKHKNGGPHV